MADINRSRRERRDEDLDTQATGSSVRAPLEKHRGFGGPGSEGRGAQQSMQEHDLAQQASQERRGPTTSQPKGGATIRSMQGNTNPLGRNEEPNPLRGLEPGRQEEEVRKRAYELYERRGRQPGHEQDDWYQAEKELKQRGKTAK